MANNLQVFFDRVEYDSHRNQSIIQGWAIDTATKSPAQIDVSIPASITPIFRPDINATYKVKQNVEYGFLIQFPGSINDLKPTITFETENSKKEFGGLYFGLNVKTKPIKKLFKVLNDQGLSKIKRKLTSKIKPQEEEPQVILDQPLDRFQKWFDLYEKNLWIDPKTLDFEKAPKVTFVLTVDSNDSLDEIEKTLDSLAEQDVKAAEIIIAATDREENVDEFSNAVTKVVIGENKTDALNKAIDESTGDYITFADSGDSVAPQLITEVIAALENETTLDFIYADSDKIDESGRRFDVQFKPDFDDVLLRSTNYILQPIIIKKELLDKVDPLKEENSGLQYFDLILKASKEAKNIKHIPKILYHWLCKNEDVALDDIHLKEYENGINILSDNFNDDLIYTNSEVDYVYDLKSKRENNPKVAVVVAVPDGFDTTEAKATVENITGAVEYPNLEVIAVNIPGLEDNSKVINKTDLESIKNSELNNKAVVDSDADVFVFVKPGFESVEMTWLNELLDYLNIESVGIIGPKFITEDYQIDKAGIYVDHGHRYNFGKGAYCNSRGFNNTLRLPKEVFAIADDCLMIEADLFKELNGFDTNLSSNESDIDLSIRAREKGKKSVSQNNVAAIIHNRKNNHEAKVNGLVKKYSPEILEDKTRNKNLHIGQTAKEFAPVGA